MEEAKQNKTDVSDITLAKLKDALESGQLDKECAEINACRANNLDYEIEQFIKQCMSHQVIFYGAPGTGKSYIVDTLTKKFNVVRTTFHPESDYSTFVGCYKPVSSQTNPTSIDYEFVAQSFIKAYVKAIKDPDNLHFLVIEEINRGNCAAIFGDMFQLLDRTDGKSTYEIDCDDDIKRYLTKENIQNPGKICLPDNLYIWATMNTSDQSLFPMDSAFKRRWDMEYVPISDADKGWKVEIKNGEFISWYDFLQWINKVILEKTQSQDKQLGYFFVKPSGNSRVITRRQFINKVIFYLWNDVFRDYMKDDTPFNLSSCRDKDADNKNRSGKEEINSFEEFLNVGTLSEFLWHLDRIDNSGSNVSIGSNASSTSGNSTLKPSINIDEKAILTSGRVEKEQDTPPNTVPSDRAAVIFSTNSPNVYYTAKSDKDAILALYYITKKDNPQQTIEAWTEAIKKINTNRGTKGNKINPSKWITRTKPNNSERWFNITTENNEIVYVFCDLSRGKKGISDSKWKFLKELALQLGVTIK